MTEGIGPSARVASGQSGGYGDQGARGPARDWIPWAVILAVALVARLIGWRLGGLVIGDEGVNYARIAESLAAGRGYLGISELGPQLIYPPLYPGSIAAGVRLGFSAEWAGRAISLLCGVATPLAFGAVARQIYGRRAGFMAGLLAAIHPLLVTASFVVLSESPYVLFVLLGIERVLACMAEPTRTRGWAAGLCFGFAYLVRPESMYLAVVCAVLLVVFAVDRWRALVAAAAIVGTLALCAIPYVVYLHRETGQWRLEAKTPQGLIWLVGLAAGKSDGELYWGIDEQLEGTGTSNTSNAAQALVRPPPGQSGAELALEQALRNLPKLFRGLAHLQFGGPAMALLVGLGLFGAAWSRGRAERELVLIAWSGLVVAPFLLWPFVLDRSLFMLLPCFVLWGARGAVQVVDWTRESAMQVGLGPQVRAVAAAGLLTAVLGTVAVSSLLGVRDTDEMSQDWSDRVELIAVGEWLGRVAPGARISDVRPTIAYYANSVLVRFPFTDGTRALAYLEKNRVDYVVLRSGELGSRPYLAGWFEAPPAPELEWMRSFPTSRGEIRVYRWRRRGG